MPYSWSEGVSSALHWRGISLCTPSEEGGGLWIWGTLLLKPSSWWESEREKRRDEGTVWSQLAGHVCYRNRERESRKRGKSPSPRQRQQQQQQQQLATGLSVSLHGIQHLSRAFLESASHSPVNVYTMHASLRSKMDYPVTKMHVHTYNRKGKGFLVGFTSNDVGWIWILGSGHLLPNLYLMSNQNWMVIGTRLLQRWG